MRKIRKEFSLTALDYRLFITMYELEEKGYYANAKGLYEIFIGHENAKDFSYLSTYKTLKNTSSKKISMRLVVLMRRKYVKYIYNPNDEKIYFALTPHNKLDTKKYMDKHPNRFAQFEDSNEINIVKI